VNRTNNINIIAGTIQTDGYIAVLRFLLLIVLVIRITIFANDSTNVKMNNPPVIAAKIVKIISIVFIILFLI